MVKTIHLMKFLEKFKEMTEKSLAEVEKMLKKWRGALNRF